MSSYTNDENNDSYSNECLHSLALTCNSHPDSGYLTIISPCSISPSRLSPCRVALNQLDSPISESDLQSPINAAKRKFVSMLDYNYYRSTRKHFDILTQLDHRDAYHLIDEIIENLSSHDFLRCFLVCRKWYTIFKDYSRRKQTKTVKRNLFHIHHHKTPLKKNKITSAPMQTITNLLEKKPFVPLIVKTTPDENLSVSAQTNNVHLTASTMTYRYGYLKYLHGPTVPKRCPICAYVSIVDVNDQHGVCTNPLCGNSFCQCCSGPYHPSSPCKATTGPIKSPWRERVPISPIFSNKTRTNLRRLLM